MELWISCKSIAKRRNSIQSISYQYESPLVTVRDLLTETVKINVAEYESRQESSELLRVLSKTEVDDKVTAGKIDFGCVNKDRKPNLETAIQAALESFEDGLVVVFVDGNQVERLDDKLSLHDGSEVTFVRMTMLAGQMW